MPSRALVHTCCHSRSRRQQTSPGREHPCSGREREPSPCLLITRFGDLAFDAAQFSAARPMATTPPHANQSPKPQPARISRWSNIFEGSCACRRPAASRAAIFPPTPVGGRAHEPGGGVERPIEAPARRDEPRHGAAARARANASDRGQGEAPARPRSRSNRCKLLPRHFPAARAMRERGCLRAKARGAPLLLRQRSPPRPGHDRRARVIRRAGYGPELAVGRRRHVDGGYRRGHGRRFFNDDDQAWLRHRAVAASVPLIDDPFGRFYRRNGSILVLVLRRERLEPMKSFRSAA